MKVEHVPERLLSILRCPRCMNTGLTINHSWLFCPSCATVIEKNANVPNLCKPVCDAVQRQKNGKGGNGMTIRALIPENIIRSLKRLRLQLVSALFGNQESFAEKVKFARHREQKKVEKVLSGVTENFLRASKGNIALEVGCGDYDRTSFFKKLVEYAICSDIYVSQSLSIIYSSAPNCFYCLMNVDDLMIADESIDFLFSSHVVEHFPNRMRNLRELHRVMKPGGIACHVVPVATGRLIRHLLAPVINILTLTPRVHAGTHGEYDNAFDELLAYRIGSWRKLFESTGFEILQEAPGIFGLGWPIACTSPTCERLHIYGTWIFTMRRK